MARKGPAPKPPIERLLAMAIESTDGCWIMQRGLYKNGYAGLYLPLPIDRRVLAHRYSYKFFITELPDELEIDHECEQRACVNPWHMEPVTHAENIRRASERLWRDRTECSRGHTLREGDVLTFPGERDGWIARKCRHCYAENNRRPDKNRNRKVAA